MPNAPSGTASTPYGFTGEYTDPYIKLVYLRSRWYSPGFGRFTSKDTWQGDYTRPQSLNKWAYVENNPVNRVDPSGMIPTLKEINAGEQVYSCNCGFIDFGHANPSTARSIIELLEQEEMQLSQISDDYRGDIFVIKPSTTALLAGNISITSAIKSGLTDTQKQAVAHGIFRELMEKIEVEQGSKKILWFTNFSFEDLTSDEIGFYLGVKYGYSGDPRSNDEAWNWLAEICGFPKDRQEAIEFSKKAYKEFGGFLSLFVNTPQEKIWLQPLLSCELGGSCDDEEKGWPTELTKMVPNPPNRQGNWWIHDAVLDGSLKSSNTFEGFYYVETAK